ncbi:MAG: NADH-quinone oxidoreductase subunit M, partial [Acidobacteriaceae bacterium]
MSTNFPLVSVLTLLPFVGGIAVLLLGRAGRSAARLTALVFAIAVVAITVSLWLRFQPAAGMQFQEWRPWEPAIGLAYHVGIDGLSLLMVAVSSIVVLMAVAASWSNTNQGSAYFALLLFLEMGLLGTYTALNFLHWFLFWELSLIPAFFLIRIWGGPG